nr:glycosyl-phosphatidylinositol-anchored molecule-like protein [Dasypus novemcinctus]
MIFFALLLAVGLPLVGTQWTFNMKCHVCYNINSFYCPVHRDCLPDIRFCLIVSIRLDSRTLLVYKNCTNNCTFVYPFEQPRPTARISPTKPVFYFVRCCSGMTCNEGGLSSVDRDILPDTTIEEEPSEGIVHLGKAKCILIFASIFISNALT